MTVEPVATYATYPLPVASRTDRLTVPGARPAPPQAPVTLGPLPVWPLVSVVIANYNYAGFVGAAIESVLAQTYDTFEVLVCDDGSTDNSREVIAAFTDRDPRVRLLTRPNGGMAAAWNTASAASRGDIVSLLDADDTFLPRKLEAVVRRFHERANAGLVLHPLLVTDAAGREVQEIPVLTRVEEGWIAEQVLRRGGRWRTVPTTGIAFRRELAPSLFPIPEDRFRWGADGFVVTLLPFLTEVAVVNEALGRYRVHGQNDLGSFGFSGAVADRVVSLVETTTAAVNRRLHELGQAEVQLDLRCNLGVTEYSFLRALTEDEPRTALFRRYRLLLRAQLANDLYGGPQKLMKSAFYSVALALPLRARRRWIGAALGHSRYKHAVQRLAGTFGGNR